MSVLSNDSVLCYLQKIFSHRKCVSHILDSHRRLKKVKKVNQVSKSTSLTAFEAMKVLETPSLFHPFPTATSLLSSPFTSVSIDLTWRKARSAIQKERCGTERCSLELTFPPFFYMIHLGSALWSISPLPFTSQIGQNSFEGCGCRLYRMWRETENPPLFQKCYDCSCKGDR